MIAPDATAEALAVLAKRKNVRVLLAGTLPDPLAPGMTMKSVAGGYLLQSRDNGHVDEERPEGRDQARADAEGTRRPAVRLHRLQAREVERHRLCQGRRHGGRRRGPDEPPRFLAHRRHPAAEAGELAKLAQSPAIGSVVASDAFFPFADGLLAAAEAGATAIIQPGGSMRDKEVIDAADEKGLAMVFTGMRHFRH